MVSADEEEQLMECEALQSIYPTEFTVLSDKVPRMYHRTVITAYGVLSAKVLFAHIHMYR